MVGKFVKFVPIHENGRSFESSEQRFDDEVFVTNKISYGCNDSNILRNEYFNNPDYTRHIFSNMGTNLYALDERNIALPIRNFNDISEFGMKYLREKDRNNSHSQGVYIVERYIISDTYGVDIESLLRYYTMISDLDKLTIDEVRSKINTCNSSNHVVMRVITYIPKSDINKYTYVYSPKCNLCIVKGVPKENVSHPKAVMLRYNSDVMQVMDDDHSTTISIDIVDSNNPYKPYYMVVGNNVQRLISNPSSTRPNGARITMKKDGVIMNDRSDYGIAELNSIGIYDNEDKALHQGDMESLLTKKRLELEDTKLELNKRKIVVENNKVKLSYDQMEHDRYISKIDKEIKLLAYKTTVFKADFEYNSALLNMERETILYKQKLQQEDYKMVGSILSFATTISKTFAGLI